jgi:hypothetical protein
MALSDSDALLQRSARTVLPGRFLLMLGGLTLVLLAGVCVLPHDRYIRFQAAREPEIHKIGWVYERIHFDPTPLDVALVGSSHTEYDLDGATIEKNLVDSPAAGWHVANLGIIHPGRDLDYLMASEAINFAHPRLLLIEVQYEEPRATHPAFALFADAGDIVAAPLVINTNYPSNVAHLPARQVSLAVQSLLPGLFDAHRQFQPALYRGTQFHDSLGELGTTIPRDTVLSTAQLCAQEADFLKLTGGKTRLPASLRGLEFRVSLLYLAKIVNLAQSHHVPFAFLYLPGWHQAAQPTQVGVYRGYGAVWSAPEVFAQENIWQEVNHMNLAGEAALSQWLGRRIGAASADLANLAGQANLAGPSPGAPANPVSATDVACASSR